MLRLVILVEEIEKWKFLDFYFKICNEIYNEFVKINFYNFRVEVIIS